MSIPLFVLVPVAHISTVNAVLAALASGTQQMVAAHAHPSDPTTITHYAMLDVGANQSNVDEFAAMTQGILPAITGEWGADGIPSGAAAVAAMTNGNMIVVPGYGVTQATLAQFIAAQRLGFNVVAWDAGES